MNMGVARVKKAKLQALKREFDTLLMREEEPVSEFIGKLSRVVNQIRGLGEKLEEGTVVAKLLHATPSKFDHITSSMEQFNDLDTMKLEDAIGSLKIHEDKLKER